MRDAVIASYDAYREEDRLTTNNARRIEFLTTTRALEALLPPGCDLLDCAAGTGVYARHFAAAGHRVTATDLTPRHIDLLRASLEGMPYEIDAAVADATDLSRFPDASFDAVLCMGPLYHLTEDADRARCLRECARVLRPGGLLAVAYINRQYVFTSAALGQPDRYMTDALVQSVLRNGVLRAGDPDCFWTDTYFATPAIAEGWLEAQGCAVIDHFAADGLSPLLRERVDALNTAQFDIWRRAHWETCREPSLLGISNHGMAIGRKTE